MVSREPAVLKEADPWETVPIPGLASTDNLPHSYINQDNVKIAGLRRELMDACLIIISLLKEII